MSPNELDVLIQATVALISLAALATSIVAFRRSGPRLTIRASTALVLFDPKTPSRPMTVVDVANNGGADAVIGQVFLRSKDGPEAFYFSPTTNNRGPSLPHRLEANGGRATWMFDYAELRKSYNRTLRDEDLILQVCVRVGAKVQRAHHPVVVNRPGDATAKFSRRERAMNVITDWLRPRVQFSMVVRLPDIDLEQGLAPLGAQNFGKWWSRPFTATLVKEVGGQSERERVPDVDQVRFPRIPPNRIHQVMVPLVDDPPEGTTLWWTVTSGRGLGSGIGAMTWGDARRYTSEWQHSEAATRRTSAPELDAGGA